MSREPALEVGECPLTRHRPLVRRVTRTGMMDHRRPGRQPHCDRECGPPLSFARPGARAMFACLVLVAR
eukprot:5552281-Prymnesium_polylepis.1